MGYGLRIENSQKVIINGAKISDFWRDGINIGYKMFDNSQNFSTNHINIISHSIENYQRNGISICIGCYITVKDAMIKNINGTLPKAGIDY